MFPTCFLHCTLSCRHNSSSGAGEAVIVMGFIAEFHIHQHSLRDQVKYLDLVICMVWMVNYCIWRWWNGFRYRGSVCSCNPFWNKWKWSLSKAMPLWPPYNKTRIASPVSATDFLSADWAKFRKRNSEIQHLRRFFQWIFTLTDGKDTGHSIAF